MNPTLAGLGLLALGIAADRKRFRFDREIPQQSTKQRGTRKRQAPRQKGEALFIPVIEPLKFKKHDHIFVLGGVEVRTTQTFLDPENPNDHGHLIKVPMLKSTTRVRRRSSVNMSTTFDPFGEGHTHKLVSRGKVRISSGPIR